MKRIAVLAAAVLVIAVAVTTASASAPKNNLKNFQHVWVVMMENTSETSLIGNTNAPYINHLANTVGLRQELLRRRPSQPAELRRDHLRRDKQASPDDNDHSAPA